MKREGEGAGLSHLGRITLVATVAFLAFLAGWFLRGGGGEASIRVETQRTLTGPQREPVALGTPAPSPEAGRLVNINTADAETLETLPGIGAKRAADIVAYRAEHGPFRVAEELTDVPGIGEGTLAGLMEYITVSDAGGTQ